MATKKELEDEIKKLKTIIREIRKEVKNSEDSLDGLDEKAFGTVGKKIVTVSFDLEKNSAVISDIEDKASDALAEHFMKQKRQYHLRGLKI